MKRLTLLMDQYRHLESGTRQRLVIGIAVCVLLIVLLSAANGQVRRMEKRRVVREADIAEMLVLKQRYQQVNAQAQTLANRMAAVRPDDSPGKVLEEIGIKGKNSQIKAVKGDERSGFVEDAAEAKIEGLTANEAINLVYRLEKGAKPVVVKRAVIKTRFDDPSRLDLTLTVALLKPAAAGQR